MVVTEHALWQPWMDQYPFVRRQAVAAARTYDCHVGVSAALRDSIVHFTQKPEVVRVIPNGVDGSVFKPLAKSEDKKPEQILYVGLLNFNKGVDLLLHALQDLVKRQPNLKLVLVGGHHYPKTRFQAERIRQMAHDLGLGSHVEFVGVKTSLEVSRYMAESAVLVLPSRRESFGAVLVEALACGTPVVATRCGGPEDIVNDHVGRLVPTDNAEALTEALADILDHPRQFDPIQLRAYALDRFGWERVAALNVDAYRDAVSRRFTAARPASSSVDAMHVVAKENPGV
jgi:glycosyltransferase involved in cell wall biosynthesis